MSDYKGPKVGKIDYRLFSELFAGRLGAEDSTVVVPPKNGVDAGVIDLGDGRVLIIAEDPIFVVPGQPLRMFGWYTVHIGASDIAVFGVKPRYMTYSLLLPPGTPDADIREIVDAIHEAAVDLGISIVGGHTGYYPGLAAPIIGGVTVFAVADRDAYVTPAGARPGDAVILTKGPAIEAVGILAVLREKELEGRLPASLLSKAKALTRQMSVVKDALIAMNAGGVTAMHDATEGGVIGGLAEVAEASGVGMIVDESRFVFPDEVRLICEAFAIDPLAAIAEGSLIITARQDCAESILIGLKKAGIAASVIGSVEKDPAKRILVRRDGTAVPLAVPDQDPFWPVFFEGVEHYLG